MCKGLSHIDTKRQFSNKTLPQLVILGPMVDHKFNYLINIIGLLDPAASDENRREVANHRDIYDSRLVRLSDRTKIDGPHTGLPRQQLEAIEHTLKGTSARVTITHLHRLTAQILQKKSLFCCGIDSHSSKAHRRRSRDHICICLSYWRDEQYES